MSTTIQATNGQGPKVATAANQKEGKPAKVNAIVKMLILSFLVGKDSYQHDTCSITLDRFLSDIGELIKKYPQKFEFKFLGSKIVVPCETANNSPLHRTYAILKQVITTIFKGTEGEAIVNDAEQVLVLKSFQSVGFKFTAYCKSSVNEAVNIWWRNKRAKISVIVEATRKVNLKMIAETKAINVRVKELRTENLTELTGLMPAATKQINLLTTAIS